MKIMLITLVSGNPEATIDGKIVERTQAASIVNKALKVGKATKLIDDNGVLKYKVFT